MKNKHEQFLRAFELTNIVFETSEKIHKLFSDDNIDHPMHKLHKEMLSVLRQPEPDDIEIFRLLHEMELLAMKTKGQQ